jgi:hypothetical protein
LVSKDITPAAIRIIIDKDININTGAPEPNDNLTPVQEGYLSHITGLKNSNASADKKHSIPRIFFILICFGY